MNDEQLDHLIAAARTNYRVPPEPHLDQLWAGIDQRRRHRASTRPALAIRWLRVAGVAAAIGVSFTLGRVSVGSDGAASPVAVAQRQATPTPVTSTTTDLLGRTVVLLSAMPGEGSDDNSDRRFAQQAGELLVTTRLLLDSRAAENDDALRSLLEDLELVLAQAARLRGGSGEASTERELITEALAQQDLVPRIRIIAAGLSAGAD